MFIRLKEFFVQDIFPLRMKKFSATMSEQRSTGYFIIASMFRYEIMKLIR